ncbi:MAG: hypothetical protein ACLR76_11265 [Alistipes sp.]
MGIGTGADQIFQRASLEAAHVASFDVDPQKVGHRIDGFRAVRWPISRSWQKHDMIVILSSPTSIASQLVVPIINAGIKGVLNFTSMPLNFPRGIFVENYDITTLLEKVAYFVKEAEENSDSSSE